MFVVKGNTVHVQELKSSLKHSCHSLFIFHMAWNAKMHGNPEDKETLCILDAISMRLK